MPRRPRLAIDSLAYHVLNRCLRSPSYYIALRRFWLKRIRISGPLPLLIPLEGLLPVDTPTRDNVSLNEQRTLDQSENKNTYPLPCFFLRGK